PLQLRQIARAEMKQAMRGWYAAGASARYRLKVVISTALAWETCVLTLDSHSSVQRSARTGQRQIALGARSGQHCSGLLSKVVMEGGGGGGSFGWSSGCCGWLPQPAGEVSDVVSRHPPPEGT